MKTVILSDLGLPLQKDHKFFTKAIHFDVSSNDRTK